MEILRFLGATCRRMGIGMNNGDAELPPLLVQLIAEIEVNFICMEGLYRIPGRTSVVNRLFRESKHGTTRVKHLEDVNSNVIASLLKKYFNELPSALLSEVDLYGLIKIGNELLTTNDDDVACHQLAELMYKLPPHNQRMLKILMCHLHRVSLHAEANKMPARNLATVFGPTLLQGVTNLDNLTAGTSAIELLISKAEYIFMG